MSTRTARHRMRRRLPRVPAASHRTLHILDVENLLGGRVWHDRVRLMWDAYPVPVGEGDLVLAGFGAGHALGGMFALPSRARIVIGGRGRDAAETALLAEIDVAWVADRFSHVVVASGDHAFTGLALALRAAGVAVTVVGRSTHISAALYVACSDDRRIEVPAA